MYEMSPSEKTMIEDIRTRLKNLYNPKRIFLFGSYAWGQPDRNSDIDIAVVLEKNDEKNYRQVQRGLKELWSIEKPVDLLIYNEHEFMEKAVHPSTLQHKIEREGVKLYETACPTLE